MRKVSHQDIGLRIAGLSILLEDFAGSFRPQPSGVGFLRADLGLVLGKLVDIIRLEVDIDERNAGLLGCRADTGRG